MKVRMIELITSFSQICNKENYNI